MDVLDDHDGVVDEDPDREDEREKGDPVEREAPGPGGEQRDCERHDHRCTDHHRLTPSEREQREYDHGQGGENELLDEGLRLVFSGGAVVPGHRRVDAVWKVDPPHLLEAANDGLRDLHCVFARFLFHRDRDGRVLHGTGRWRRGRTLAVDHVVLRLCRAFAHLRDVAKKHRRAVVNSDDQVGNLLRRDQEGAGLHQDLAIVVHHLAGVGGGVGSRQRPAQVPQGQTHGGEPSGIELDADHPLRAAERLDPAGPGHPLKLGLHRVRDAQQVQSSDVRILAPERARDDRHVVDPPGLDQRRANADVRRQPVRVRVERVVEAHDRLGARLTDLEANRQRGHPRCRRRVHVLDAADLRDDPLGGRGHQRLDLGHGRARKRDEHVGERHVDRGLFLARGDQHREKAEKKSSQREEGRDLGC